MANGIIDQYVRLLQFPTGRRMFALRQVRRVAEALGDTALVARVEAALEHEGRVFALERRWASDKNGQGAARGNAFQIDVLIDRTLSAIDGGAAQAAVALRPGHPLAEKAARFRAHAFPGGVGAVVNLTYEEELAYVDWLLSELDNPDQPWGPTVAELGLTLFVTELRARVVEMRAELERERPRPLRHEELRAARATGQRGLLVTIAHILGNYDGDDDRARQLLAPISDQNERISAARRRWRATTDVDPETGEETGPVEIPAAATAPAAAPPVAAPTA